MKIILAAALLALTTVALPAVSIAATPVTVTDTVTGGPGAYTHNFSLTNNFGDANVLYFFGVDLSGTITGTPASWNGTNNGNAPWSNTPYGGSPVVYPITWCCAGVGTPSGVTTKGFSVLSTLNPATIRFFSYAKNGQYAADDAYFYIRTNPGFEDLMSDGSEPIRLYDFEPNQYIIIIGAGLVGAANSAVAAVPEPANWVMLIAGFGLVGAAMRRRTAALAA